MLVDYFGFLIKMAHIASQICVNFAERIAAARKKAKYTYGLGNLPISACICHFEK